MSTHNGNLRNRLIRLAHANPTLRPHLLPILKEARQADQQYQARMREVRHLLLVIGQLLDDHAEEQRLNPDNWGFSGDLANCVSSLEHVRDFLRS